MMSFATRKGLPAPGEKRMVFMQPIHRGQYAEFEGQIHRGYGKGVVKTHDRGTIVVTHADPDKIKFVVAHRKFPEYYTMVRTKKPYAPTTAREREAQGGSWLMINHTPMDAAKFLKGVPGEVGLKKLKYTKVPAEQVDKLFSPDYMVQEKIDGASALYHLLGDRIEALSYRVSKDQGRPIIHTYRIFGPGRAIGGIKLPEELKGTILRGEVYGTRPDGSVIPPQELGGILNSSVQNSLEKQRERRIVLKNMIFDVVRKGKEPIPPKALSAQARQEALREISKHLPQDRFHLPETAETPEEAKALYERISSGVHPRTSEGIVAWPMEPGKVPRKVKPRPERDVWVRNIFPGEGRLAGSAAGGFEYSLSPEGPVVGRVGTGFTDKTRQEMWTQRESWPGRMARISTLAQHPSGAYREPSFIALHEDYPLSTQEA
jgi:ATP-dependent DNA ligase